MKAVVLLSKIALSAVLAFALIVWFESGIEGFPNYCQAEGDINGIIPALSFKHLNAGHPSPNDEYPDKRINSKDPWGNTFLILPMFLVVQCLHPGVRAVWHWKRSGKS